MKPREQFGLVLRIIGVLGIAYTVRTFVRCPSPDTLRLVAEIAGVLIGVYLVRGAPLLLKFAYPDSAPEAPEKTTA